MKYITLKSLFNNILLVSIIIFVFLVFNIITTICKISDLGIWGILLCIVAWCVLGLPLVIRYIYVKKVCCNCEIIDAVIVDKCSSIFVRNGTYYKVCVKGTNTCFDTSTKYGVTSHLHIKDEVIICIDQENKEAIIVNIK